MTVAIHIPVYNQPALLDRCLRSIERQTRPPEEIVIVDDFSSTSYQEVLSRFGHLNIRYERNPRNLGAVPNMLHALHLPTSAEFVNVFHEDDIMHPEFLAASLRGLASYPEALFCASRISFFADEREIQFRLDHTVGPQPVNAKSLIARYLAEETIGLGTVVYRKKRMPTVPLDYDRYSVFGDRPFLLELLGQGEAVVLPADLVAAYDHGVEDRRWTAARTEHVFNLYRYYRLRFGPPWSPEESKLVRSGVTRGIQYALRHLLRQGAMTRCFNYGKGWLLGLVSIKYLLLSNRTVRHFADRVYGGGKSATG